MDSETLECRMCRREFWDLLEGACLYLLRSDHRLQACNDNVKPSMDTDGRFCSCFEPQAEDAHVGPRTTTRPNNRTPGI